MFHLAPPPQKGIEQKTKLYTPITRFWGSLGPGLITGASDDDPSGIATYSQAGAAFGLATLWTALLTIPLMAAVQEMCARIGMVTKKGLAGVIKMHYPRTLMYVMLALSFPAIVLNIGADIEGMGAVAHLVFPNVSIAAFSVFFTILLVTCIIAFSYRTLATVLKWLCLALLLYVFVPLMIKVDWREVAMNTFTPTFHSTRAFFAILVAIFGTTISPYLFFWQANMEIEHVALTENANSLDRPQLNEMKKDVKVGMIFSNAVMFFIILTTGIVLYKGGIRQIDTVDQAAKALEPLAGKATYLMFAAGVIGTGLLAIPVLAGSLSYIMAETFEWKSGLNKKYTQAKGFYRTLIISMFVGLGLNFLGISPIQALIYTAILYGVTAPVLIAVIMHICNNRKVMGEFTNDRSTNIHGLVTLILMSVSAVALFLFQ